MIDPAFFTALVASRICHDLVNPASSVSSAIEMLDDPDAGEEMQAASNALLRDSAQKLEATILFLRYAFGSGGMSDSIADIHEAKRIGEKYAALHKPELSWDIETAHFTSYHVRMLLQLVLLAITSLPRGGEMTVRIKDQDGMPGIAIHCVAHSLRPGVDPVIELKPEIRAVIDGQAEGHSWDARSINAIFASRVAQQLNTKITASQLSPSEVIFAANRLSLTATVGREGLS